MEAWFCYCLYSEVEYGWNRICQDPFLRFRITVSQKRNCVRLGSRDKAAVITFGWFPLLVWWENDAEIRRVPGYLHSPARGAALPTCQHPSLPGGRSFLQNHPLAAAHVLSQAPTLLQCFSRLASSLSLNL